MKRLAFALGLLVLSCAEKEESQIKSHATPNNENVRVVRVNDLGTNRYFLVNQGKGYEIICDKFLKRKNLIESVGFPYAVMEAGVTLFADSNEFLNLQVESQPTITCDSSQKVLYQVLLEGKMKYFFADPARSKTRLYMLGCQKLLDAMGFDAKLAKNLDPSFIEKLKIYTAKDEDDIHCLQGSEVGSKVSWDIPEEVVIRKPVGSDLGTLVYAAKKPDGTAARLEISNREGLCDWIEVANTSATVVLSGILPAQFLNQSCKVTLAAEKGTMWEGSRVLAIYGEIPPVQKVQWTDSVGNSLAVRPLQTLTPMSLTAVTPEQLPAELTVKSQTGICEWIKVASSGTEIKITGEVPASFVNQSCELAILAEEGKAWQETRNLTIRNSVLRWNRPGDDSVTVKTSYYIDLIQVAAAKADGTAVQVELANVEEACSWIKAETIQKSVVLSGKVPEEFANRECKATFIADRGTVHEESHILKIKSQLIETFVASSCPQISKMFDKGDFTACRLETSLGELKITYDANPACDGFFQYDPQTKMLQLGSAKNAPGVCSIVFHADSHGVISKPYQVSVDLRACPSGYVPVPADKDYEGKSFCVMKYEATQHNNQAVSAVGNYPWRSISWSDANNSCKNLGTGHHLVTNNEWMTIANNATQVGSNWSSGSMGAGALVGGKHQGVETYYCPTGGDDRPFPTPNGCTTSSVPQEAEWRRTHQLSNGEVIWDLASGVAEYTGTLVYQSWNMPTIPGSSNNSGELNQLQGTDYYPVSNFIPVAKPWWNRNWESDVGIGYYWGYLIGRNEAFAWIRGSDNLGKQGIYTVTAGNGNPSLYVGFRCAYSE